VNKNILLQPEIFRNIRAAFTTTVYAFLNPRRPSAAWDFFCLEFSECSQGVTATDPHRSPVGAGLPAKAACQAKAILNVPASSLASQLLQGSSVNTTFVNATKHCRSRLAGEGVVSGEIN
jgi:hypothetical protein